ncbi:MAG: hypothetical protein NTV30_10825 [Chloroflexi bacterium]|nr:hypothetical protein [Chloroflexota bacterium]
MLKQKLTLLYETLLQHYGPQHWWPGDSPFEVIIGAILTQSAAWTNVEKSITKLKEADLLNPVFLRNIPQEQLASLLYSCGYYNAKSLKIKSFVHYLGIHYNDNLNLFFNQETDRVRNELLSIYGIGNETADSILLYAAGKPVFVIDAYTKRIFNQIGLFSNSLSYSDLQLKFMKNLQNDTYLFNEYHALFVRHGKDVCRKSPRCGACCLASSRGPCVI